MSSVLFYAMIGCLLFALGLYALILQPHLLRKILAINIISSGVLLLLVALAKQSNSSITDPVPHAMVLTGIVVAVSASALALTLMIKLVTTTGRCDLSDDL